MRHLLRAERVEGAVAVRTDALAQRGCAAGQVVLKNVCGTGVDFVTTRALPRADQDLRGTDHE